MHHLFNALTQKMNSSTSSSELKWRDSVFYWLNRNPLISSITQTVYWFTRRVDICLRDSLLMGEQSSRVANIRLPSTELKSETSARSLSVLHWKALNVRMSTKSLTLSISQSFPQSLIRSTSLVQLVVLLECFLKYLVSSSVINLSREYPLATSVYTLMLAQKFFTVTCFSAPLLNFWISIKNVSMSLLIELSSEASLSFMVSQYTCTALPHTRRSSRNPRHTTTNYNYQNNRSPLQFGLASIQAKFLLIFWYLTWILIKELLTISFFSERTLQYPFRGSQQNSIAFLSCGRNVPPHQEMKSEMPYEIYVLTLFSPLIPSQT